MHLQERRTLNQKLFFAWKIWEREAAPACLDRLSWVSKQDAHVPFGMKTLKQYAMVLMAEGLTSVEEVLTNLVVSD